MKKVLTILAVMLVIATLGSAAAIKLDAAKQKKLNVFFSNFSEANVDSFAQGELSDQAMLDFALSHVYINKFKSLKKSKDGNSVIATSKQVDTATMKYFGQKIKKHKENSYTIPCADGEVFYFSQLDSLEDLGKKTFKATGTVYSTGSGGTPDVHGTPAEWEKAEEDVGVASKFSALIKSEGERYLLVEYSLADTASDEAQTADISESDSTDSAEESEAERLQLLVLTDIFDWHVYDQAKKIEVINQMKQLWRDNGDETDANAIDAKTICNKLVLGDQANIFEEASEVAGIDTEKYSPIFEGLGVVKK